MPISKLITRINKDIQYYCLYLFVSKYLSISTTGKRMEKEWKKNGKRMEKEWKKNGKRYINSSV
jgi:hypothetical protein